MIGNTKMECRKLLAIFMVCMLCVSLLAPGVRAEDNGENAQGPAGAAGGTHRVPAGDAAVDELVNILVLKGVLKQDDVAAMMQKKGEPGFSALAALTELLRAKGVLSADEASKVAKKAEGTPAERVTLYYERDPKELEKITQDVTREIKKDVGQTMKAEIKEEVIRETRKEMQSAAAPEWTKRIQFGGDIRLRYQGDYFDANNSELLKPSDPSTVMNTTEDRHRFRVRARIGATAEVYEKVQVGARLTTGNTTNPVTTNQTMGTSMNKYSAVFDLAYLKARPWRNLTLLGGRIPNPFFFTDLVWNRDLTFDGFAASYRGKFSDAIQPFATAGTFPLEEVELSQKDKWLFAGQVGFDFKPRTDLFGKIGLAYYDYRNTRGVVNDPSLPGVNDYTAPSFQQKGNTLFDIDPTSSYKFALAAEYRELNLTAMLDIGLWDPIHVILLGDYVKNIGFDRSKVAMLTGNPDVREYTQGYQAGLSVGHPIMQRFGDWKIFGYYKYLGADAVLDAFTDASFHLGGTNARGWILGAEFGLGKNIWLAGRWLTSNEVSGPPLSIDVLQIDLNTRF
jgi:hypothetical protein